MAAFTPTPRRTVPRRSTPGTTPPPPSIWRKPPAARPVTSRFATPVRATPVREESVASMDVDEPFDRVAKADSVFAQSDEMQVSFYSHLPAEVKHILRNADFQRDAYNGDVDTLTGFAVVASSETCFVWKYSQALAGVPTCYIFPCPQETLYLATPFHALVPNGPAREPGLIVVNSAGQIRFWESLASGLAGGEHWTSSSLDLVDEEMVSTLTRADPQTFIVSTSLGRLFRLTLTSSGGRYHLSPKPFARAQSALSLSRLLPSFLTGGLSLPYEFGSINAVALREYNADVPTGRHVWTLIDNRIQRWTMSVEGWEELERDDDVADIVRPALRVKFENAPQDDAELDLELLDLKLLSADELLVLISYAGQDEALSLEGLPLPRRMYALLQMSSAHGPFEVANVRSIPYQSTSTSGAPMHPQMQLLLRGRLVTIQFGDCVTICALENEYVDRLQLKSASDRTLGVGVVPGETEFLVLTAATLMKTYVDIDAVERFDPELGKANLIKSMMTQAILYGSHKDNPLHFSFPPEVDEDALMTGAEQLSKAILESDPKVVRSNPDLSAQITHRKERLQFLIQFINDNGVLTKMSQRCRQHLESNAEKLEAAYDLWQYYNETLSFVDHRDVLSESIYFYMNSVGEGHHEDYMRAFFRLRVGDLGAIVPRIKTYIREAKHDVTKSPTSAIPQANHIILTVLNSARRCRNQNWGLYGIIEPLINPWTSQPSIMDVIHELIRATVGHIEQSSSGAEQPVENAQAKQQLPALAAALFSCYRERLEWLGSPIAASDEANARERDVIEERFKRGRSEVLESLRRHDFANEAFQLAEEYRDFRTLASLCNRDTIYPPQDNPNAGRIQSYVEKFKEDFTNELYQWYIEHGELRTLFASGQDNYLDKFFAAHPHPNFSWIHHLGEKRYDLASEILLEQAYHATELSSKHLMLSIGKLSYLSQLHEDVAPSINEDVLNAFHDGLDFVSVHETLIDNLKSSIPSSRTRQSLEQQVDAITKEKASHLVLRKAFYAIFKRLVRQLLQGKALTVEDAADVLSSMKSDRLDDFITALHLLSTAKQLPPVRRQSTLRSVWRRIYLYDDWNAIRQTAGVSDAEVNERYRKTALYAVLQATTHGISSLVLSPEDTLVVPSLEELSSRWSGLSSEDLASVQLDYEADVKEIWELQLGDVFVRVKELVNEDQGSA